MRTSGGNGVDSSACAMEDDSETKDAMARKKLSTNAARAGVAEGLCPTDWHLLNKLKGVIKVSPEFHRRSTP